MKRRVPPWEVWVSSFLRCWSWQFVPHRRAWTVLPGAMVAWLAVSVLIWGDSAARPNRKTKIGETLRVGHVAGE